MSSLDSAVSQYIFRQPLNWQCVLSDIHELILLEDTSVFPCVELMMGKEMIVYKCNGMMKYALVGLKNFMSLHVLVMYGSPVLFAKYNLLLSHLKFQKSCIHFNSAEQMPLDIVKNLISDCAGINLNQIRADYLASKKLKLKT